jgi:hypothetical protein
MATSLSYDQAVPGDPVRVLALLVDPDYVRAKAERTGAFDIEVEVVGHPDGRTTVTSTRSMPAEVPSYATAFVGEHLTVTEVQEWSPLGPDGTATAQVSVDFHAPLAYAGTITLGGDAGGSTLANRGEFRASVPFVGGKVERVAEEMTRKYLAKESDVASEWLTG